MFNKWWKRLQNFERAIKKLANERERERELTTCHQFPVPVMPSQENDNICDYRGSIGAVQDTAEKPKIAGILLNNIHKRFHCDVFAMLVCT